MTIRTFRQFGQAYGSMPATITATIDGTVIFSGEIPTIDAPMPGLPDFTVKGVELFTWTNTIEFSGTQSFSISVANSPLLLTHSDADHCIPDDVSLFSVFYNLNDGVNTIEDPLQNVTIDGISLQRSSTDLAGQWYWTIPAGSTFSATLHVNRGAEPPSA